MLNISVKKREETTKKMLNELCMYTTNKQYINHDKIKLLMHRQLAFQAKFIKEFN